MANDSGCLPLEQQVYEINDLWTDESLSEEDALRIEALTDRIPADAKTIVDVGCGNGIFVNHLLAGERRFERLCGVDRSEAALRHVRTEKRVAPIEALPFRDREFGLAACLEVIEHLPAQIYERALRELCRVSGKYVLISVPYNEILSRLLIPCPLCCTRFNADYHMRSFDRPKIGQLLVRNGFHSIDVFFICRRAHYVGSTLYRRIRSMKKTFPWYAVCPMCGHKGEGSPQRVTPAVPQEFPEHPLRRMAKQIWPHYWIYRWIAGLYEREP